MELLERTKAAFAEQQKEGKRRRRYPEEIKRDAVSLLSHYSIQTLCHELDVSIMSLRNWRNRYDSLTDAEEPVAFVPLNFNNEPAHVAEVNIPLTLKLANQMELNIPSQSINNQDTVQFICSLIRECQLCCI